MHPASIPKLTGMAPGPSQRRGQRGAVLLEVVLALVLFVAAASVLTGGLSSSLDSLERLRVNTHAADLAVTVLSELQMGLKSVSLNGPQPFDLPLEGWTWEVVSTPLESGFDEGEPVQNVEIIIRHDESALVYRLTQMLQVGSGRASGNGESSSANSFQAEY